MACQECVVWSCGAIVANNSRNVSYGDLRFEIFQLSDFMGSGEWGVGRSKEQGARSKER